jgi:hypothetical protein
MRDITIYNAYILVGICSQLPKFRQHRINYRIYFWQASDPMHLFVSNSPISCSMQQDNF